MKIQPQLILIRKTDNHYPIILNPEKPWQLLLVF
jgi:hypothetical protein